MSDIQLPGQKSNLKVTMQVSTVSIAVNILLSVFKLIAGILAHSSAMISDAVHSASDVFSTFVVMIGVSISEKKPDREHPYGHERFECVASILLAVILAATGLGIGWKGVQTIASGKTEELTTPGVFALGAAVVSCRRGGNTASFDMLNKYFTISGMPVVSSRYWNMVHGFTAQDVEKDREGLQTMRILGRNMAFLLRAIAAEKEKHGLPPREEKQEFTSFPDGK